MGKVYDFEEEPGEEVGEFGRLSPENCSACGEEITEGEQYYTIELHRERLVGDGDDLEVEVLGAQVITQLCEKCFEEGLETIGATQKRGTKSRA